LPFYFVYFSRILYRKCLSGGLKRAIEKQQKHTVAIGLELLPQRRRRTSITAFNLAVTSDRYAPPQRFRFACFPQTSRQRKAQQTITLSNRFSRHPVQSLFFTQSCVVNIGIQTAATKCATALY